MLFVDYIKNSRDVDGKGDVSGQDPPDQSVDELQASDQGPGPSTPADPSLDQVALVADQPGLGSPLARGEAPVPAGVAQPPELVPGEEPVPVAPAAAGEIAASPAAQNLTEEQAPTPLVEPVLSPSGAVGVADGGTAEEEAGGEAGSSSADPASEFMRYVDDLSSAIDTLDHEVVGPMVTEKELNRMEYVAGRLEGAARRLRHAANP